MLSRRDLARGINARVGQVATEGIIGGHGVPCVNENGVKTC